MLKFLYHTYGTTNVFFWDICSIASLSLLRPYIGGAIVTPSRGLILHWSFYMSSIVSISSSSSHSLQQSGPSLPYNEVSYLILQWSFNVYSIILERNSKLKGREQVIVLEIFSRYLAISFHLPSSARFFDESLIAYRLFDLLFYWKIYETS